jgi:ribulose-5-phosphate 4-epimerase/fuculose-1-phosphate aldolase
MKREMRAVLAAAASAVVATVALAGQAPAPVSAGTVDPKVLEDFVFASHVLAALGIVDSQGHVSMRHPGDPNRYLISSTRAPALVTVADIQEYDLDSNPVDARGRPSFRERFIHGEVYKARPDVKSVVHAHSSSVIPFSVSNVPLRAMAHSGAFLGSGLPVFEIRRTAGMTDMLVSSPAIGRALAQTLGDKAALLMRGHGVVTVGGDLHRAVGRAVYLDENAKLQREAMSLGGTITYLDPEEARKVEAARDYERQWEMWSRQLAREK